jgi:hypothetical protein
VLPGFVTILALSVIYTAWGHVPLVEGIFFGIKPAVLALVLEAVLRIGRRALGHAVQVAIAALAFVAIFFFHVGFPWIVLAAALVGLVGSRVFPRGFRPPPPAAPAGGPAVVDALLDREIPRARAAEWGARAARRGGVPRALVDADCAARVRARGGGRVSRSSACSSASSRWSRSAARTPCSPTWRSRRSKCTAGSRRARCSTGSAWPRRRPGR